MTLPVTRKNSAILSTTVTTEGSLQKPHGWDPFEVWRTRILLPRLAEKAKQEPLAPTVQLVHR
jgi:hypothetical protein